MAEPKITPVYAADDLVPDRESAAYKSLVQAYQQGGRVSMKGLTREEMKLALRGKLPQKV